MYIFRFKYSANGTFGIYFLEANGKIIQNGFTLEPGPNHGKGPIPPGIYHAQIIWWDRQSPKSDYYVYKLSDVPERKGILIHAGNRQSDTSGCILPGERYAPSGNSISGSKVATDNLIMGPLFEEPLPGLKALDDISLIVYLYDLIKGCGFVVDKPGYIIICEWTPIGFAN